MNNIAYYRNLVVLAGLGPLLMLSWDAWHDQLGANGVNNALHITGILSLVFFVYLSSHHPITSNHWVEQHHRIPTSFRFVWVRVRCDSLCNLRCIGSNGKHQ